MSNSQNSYRKLLKIEKALEDAGYEIESMIETAHGIQTFYSVTIMASIFQTGDFKQTMFVALTPDEDKVLIFEHKTTLTL